MRIFSSTAEKFIKGLDYLTLPTQKLKSQKLNNLSKVRKPESSRYGAVASYWASSKGWVRNRRLQQSGSVIQKGQG